MTAEIPVRSARDASADVADVLAEHGCVVIEGLADDATRQQVIDDLQDHMARASTADTNPEDFYAGKTRRVIALVTRSEGVRTLIQDPLIHDLCEAHLGANCAHHQIQVTAALNIGPGARAQVLHREEDLYPSSSCLAPTSCWPRCGRSATSPPTTAAR
ncbi:MAG: phytanoyl-CoA dioxygenase family protein [Acidimicrobiales bacterium]